MNWLLDNTVDRDQWLQVRTEYHLERGACNRATAEAMAQEDWEWPGISKLPPVLLRNLKPWPSMISRFVLTLAWMCVSMMLSVLSLLSFDRTPILQPWLMFGLLIVDAVIIALGIFYLQLRDSYSFRGNH